MKGGLLLLAIAPWAALGGCSSSTSERTRPTPACSAEQVRASNALKIALDQMERPRHALPRPFERMPHEESPGPDAAFVEEMFEASSDLTVELMNLEIADVEERSAIEADTRAAIRTAITALERNASPTITVGPVKKQLERLRAHRASSIKKIDEIAARSLAVAKRVNERQPQITDAHLLERLAKINKMLENKAVAIQQHREAIGGEQHASLDKALDAVAVECGRH